MTSIEEDPSAISRQAATKLGIRLCEELALLAGVTLHTMSQVFQKPALPLHTVGYGPEFPHRLINQTHLNLQGSHIHNLGVYHTEPFFHQHQSFFEQKIRDCDVLCIEGNPYSSPEYTIPSARRFFEKCTKPAIAQQKTIYFIDEINKPLIVFQGTFAIPVAMLSPLGMQIDSISALKKFERDQQQGKTPSLPLFSTRRNFLRALTAMGLGSAWLLRMPETDKPEEYDGYFQRGRSAIMMRNIRTIAEASPSAKLLAITGNAHAELFEHYLANPTLLERDLHDYRIHDAIYSLPMEKMEPGDREPAVVGI